MMDLFEPNRLSVLDVENIRLHYAKTLEHWLERYEENVDAVRSLFDEKFVRAWRLYLVGSIAAFLTGKLQLFQVLYARSGAKEVPWTRAHVYADRSLAATRRRRLGSRAIGRAARATSGSRSRRSPTCSATSRAAPPRGASRCATSTTCSRSTPSARTVEVEGLTTYETVVKHCLAARLPAARRARAQAHHGRRRDRRHRHRVDVLPLRLRARRPDRSRRAAAERQDRHRARRQRIRRPLSRAAELLRHARLHPAREDRAAPGRALRPPAHGALRQRRRRTSKRCAPRPRRTISRSSKACSSRTAAIS